MTIILAGSTYFLVEHLKKQSLFHDVMEDGLDDVTQKCRCEEKRPMVLQATLSASKSFGKKILILIKPE